MASMVVSVALAAGCGLLGVAAWRMRRRVQRLERELAAAKAEAANTDEARTAALRALNEAILINGQLRKAQPALVMAGDLYVQSYATVKHFSLN